tara:strand:+ start:4385 stop:5671 length:1287 start_codon:yes stop_codon:yes gene_type:complete
MALSAIETTYTGGPQEFPINFELGYLSRDDVYVQVNGAVVKATGDPVYANYEYIDDANIRILDPLTNGDVIRIRRIVSKTELQVDFVAGADVTAANINAQTLQSLMIYQEMLDGFVDDNSPREDADRADASAEAAEISETNAAASEAAAAISDANVQDSWYEFDVRYLGAFSSDPTVDNNGDPLIAGALNWNTGLSVMRVYDGALWATLGVPSSENYLLSTNNLVDLGDPSVARTNLGVEIGTDVASPSFVTGITDPLNDQFIGAVLAFARPTAPTGWLIADGSAISRTTYADLFAAIGTYFGIGDGSTTFDIPDLRDRYPRGVSGSHTLGTYLADQNAAHTHGPGNLSGSTNTTGNHQHAPSQLYIGPFNGANNDLGAGSSGSFRSEADLAAGDHSHTVTLSGGATASEGGTEARPNSAVLTFCIKY